MSRKLIGASAPEDYEQPEYLTHAEVAKLLRTTPNSLHALYARRRPYLPPRHKFGSRLLYKRAEVEACLKPVPH